MPLFKTGETYLSSNFRPIVLLSNVGKIMERAVHKHIHNHLISNNLVCSKQSGFLAGHSTVFNLLTCITKYAKVLIQNSIQLRAKIFMYSDFCHNYLHTPG